MISFSGLGILRPKVRLLGVVFPFFVWLCTGNGEIGRILCVPSRLCTGNGEIGRILCVPSRLCTGNGEFDSSWCCKAMETVISAFPVGCVLGTAESEEIFNSQ